MVGFMLCYNFFDEGFFFCEIGVVEYFFNGGILRKMYYFIKLGLFKCNNKLIMCLVGVLYFVLRIYYFVIFVNMNFLNRD